MQENTKQKLIRKQDNHNNIIILIFNKFFNNIVPFNWGIIDLIFLYFYQHSSYVIKIDNSLRYFINEVLNEVLDIKIVKLPNGNIHAYYSCWLLTIKKEKQESDRLMLKTIWEKDDISFTFIIPWAITFGSCFMNVYLETVIVFLIWISCQIFFIQKNYFGF